MSSLFISLRVVHVLSAIFWVGTSLFTALFLFPALALAGAAAGPVMGGLQRKGVMIALPLSGILTLLSGLTLFYLASGGAMGAYAQTPVGRTFAMSGGFAILAFIVGMLVARPTGMMAVKLGREAATMPAGTDRDRLQAQLGVVQRRSARASIAVTVLLVAAAAGMATARYMN